MARKRAATCSPLAPGPTISQERVEALKDFMGYDPVHESLMKRVRPLTAEEVAEVLGCSEKAVPNIKGLPVLTPVIKTPGASHARKRMYPASGVAMFRAEQIRFQSGDPEMYLAVAQVHAWPTIRQHMHSSAAFSRCPDMALVALPLYAVARCLGLDGRTERVCRELLILDLPGTENGYVVSGALVNYLAQTIQFQGEG